MRIVPLTAAHWPEVRDVYARGIATGESTLESEPPDWDRFDAGKLPDHRFVAVDEDGTVLGWVAASPTSERAVYAGVVEVSVYVHPDAHGRGVGRALLTALLASTDRGGIWTVQAVVFPENRASVALHTSLGFRVVGRRERLGRAAHGPRAGTWRDVLLLERRRSRD
ncbi:N-acetyltransferase family protein [Cellulomonas shaoxiangyii]|uniref:N-acetyltransferase family protein n=1 Tax=Cellulomonas shaoxiangyii TaxID=2566013 RepID=A0A4V1CN75_9CELL|nr:N-acetyltransferase family protein [Cellulomonas shaoxiangyii]TGY85082.1 N-acetyltransferase family protein [Cellulomonas shaoxiangyii]